MAINSAMMPELVDPSGFDSILQTGYEPYHAAQLAQWGLPIRPAMGADRRRRAQYADQIMAENQIANQMRNDLSNRQLDVDVRGQDVDLTKNINTSLDPGNDSAMAALGLNQEQLVDPAYFDQILNSGDAITRAETIAKGNKAQAEAESEPIKAQAALENARNAGSSGDNFELEYNANGDLIGFKQKGKGQLPGNKGNPTATTSIYDEGNNQPLPELESKTGTGQRLIRNSDGTATIVNPDGTVHRNVSKEELAAKGL